VTRISIKFTAKELELLSSLASDQLFRREFIDPRLPGYRSNATELGAGKKLVERLRFLADRARRMPAAGRNGLSASKIS
jgi:hypothetical protein